MSFFDRPILNSPYAYPGQHWELDEDGHPTEKVLDARRSSALWTALPGASSKSARSQQSLVFDSAGVLTW